MSANIIKAVRKSLGNEALEKRISELEERLQAREARMAVLEDKVAELQANVLPDAFLRDGGVYGDEPPEMPDPPPKKRKTRAKTYGTE